MLTKRWKKLIQRIGKMELRERSFVFRVFTQKINRSTFLPGNICAVSKFANESKWRKAKFWKLIPRVKQKKFVDKWKLKIKLNHVQSSSVCTKWHSSRRKPGIEKFSFHCSLFFSKKFPLCLLFLRASRNFCVTVKLLPSRHLLQADKYCTRRSILDWRKFQLLTALTPKKIFTSNTSGKNCDFIHKDGKIFKVKVTIIKIDGNHLSKVVFAQVGTPVNLRQAFDSVRNAVPLAPLTIKMHFAHGKAVL